MLDAIGRLRCRLFHRRISTPINGRYICWSCLRTFPAWSVVLAPQAEAERWAKAAANGWSLEESAEMEGRR
jgi:hypothetical protein